MTITKWSEKHNHEFWLNGGVKRHAAMNMSHHVRIRCAAYACIRCCPKGLCTEGLCRAEGLCCIERLCSVEMRCDETYRIDRAVAHRPSRSWTRRSWALRSLAASRARPGWRIRCTSRGGIGGQDAGRRGLRESRPVARSARVAARLPASASYGRAASELPAPCCARLRSDSTRRHPPASFRQPAARAEVRLSRRPRRPAASRNAAMSWDAGDCVEGVQCGRCGNATIVDAYFDDHHEDTGRLTAEFELSSRR